MNRVARRLVAAVAVGLATAGCACPDGLPPVTEPLGPTTLDPAVAEELDRELLTVRSEQGIPGLAVGVVEEGTMAYVRSFGVATLEPTTALRPDTPFPAASISKLFTTLVVLQLVDDGRLALDSPLSELGFEGVWITPRELLTHRSGLRDGDGPDAVLSGELSTGTKVWSYADANFDLLGRVVERIAGEPFAAVARRRVLEPVGMEHSTFDTTVPSVVDGHVGCWFGGGRRAVAPPADPDSAPSEGLRASVVDLTRWMEVVLGRSPRLASAWHWDAMFESAATTDWPDVDQGLGWQVETGTDEWIVRHAGSVDGIRALLTLWPDRGRGIVVLGNAESLQRWVVRSRILSILDIAD